MPKSRNLREHFNKLNLQRRVFRFTKLTSDYGYVDYDSHDITNSVIPARPNLVGSELTPTVAGQTFHAPIFDIDVPHRYVPSSTEGHGHLYIDVPVTTAEYFNILRALTNAGIIEEGWVNQALNHGIATVRAPGVTKQDLPADGQLDVQGVPF